LVRLFELSRYNNARSWVEVFELGGGVDGFGMGGFVMLWVWVGWNRWGGG